MKEVKIIVLFIATLFFAGCLDEVSDLPEENSIVDENLPDAFFTVLQRDLEDFRTVTLNNLSTEAINFEWDLGDGTIVTNSSPIFTHTYDTDVEMEYTITLTASDALGNSSMHTETIVISEFIVPSFVAMQSEADITGIWQEVFFTNTSVGATSYLWDFGDGNTSPDFEPTHIYNVSMDATFVVTLTVFNDAGDEESISQVINLQRPELFDVQEGDFELGDLTDVTLDDGTRIDDPIGDSRNAWRTDIQRVVGFSSVIQISNTTVLGGNFAGQLPAIEEDSDNRLGYQELVFAPNTNYRLTYIYRIENDFPANGVLNIGMVQPLSDFSEVQANTIALNSHEEFNEATGTVNGVLEFNSGDNTDLAVIFFNEVERVRIDNIEIDIVE